MRLAVVFVVFAACGENSAAPDAGATGSIFINEVMPSNTAACADPFGEFDDWIELYNAGDTDFALDGYTLSDDPIAPAKGALDTLVVPAGGYKMLWLDDQIEGLDHFAFKLDADGEQIALYAPDGSVVDTLMFGTTDPDVSYARVPDGGAFTTCKTSSCGVANACTP
jgi:hypothetical protein